MSLVSPGRPGRHDRCVNADIATADPRVELDARPFGRGSVETRLAARSELPEERVRAVRDLARQRAREAVALAEDPRRRHGYATALAHAAMVEQCRLDVAATRTTAEAAIEAVTESGYAYRIAMGTILNGWALAAEGSYEQGIAELERGLELSRKTGARMDDPYFLALLADACMRAGQLHRASAAVETGLAHMARGRRFFIECELHRLAGELLLRFERLDDGETRLRKALRLARAQRSPSLELRAALSLANHLRAEGGTNEAEELIAGVYSTFTEGFETHDLVAARELLAAHDASALPTSATRRGHKSDASETTQTGGPEPLD
jgi:ATP/maltotriose-dependent transcriptional regulator MalT